jgi:hypothetical protein
VHGCSAPQQRHNDVLILRRGLVTEPTAETPRVESLSELWAGEGYYDTFLDTHRLVSRSEERRVGKEG